jgi:Response regulator containing CheY-like receiver, AAA-type ATPase, and DNA-binding domains
MATHLPGILIVDDNEDNRYTLQLMLESDGHERITCATGGNEAITLIEKEKFSLVLLDLMMPDLMLLARARQKKERSGLQSALR